MVLKRNIGASSIAEVVIALAVIALCFTVASLVFVRSTGATLRFVDFKTQTHIQSELMEAMIRGEAEIVGTDTEIPIEQSEEDSTVTTVFFGSDNRIIWTQEWLKEE